MNKFETFTPLMHEKEYKFLEKFLTPDDILLEWGSGNSTIYYSGIVKKLISIEHDIYYYDQIKKTIDVYDIKNVDLIHIPPQNGENRKEKLNRKLKQILSEFEKNQQKLKENEAELKILQEKYNSLLEK
jgi:hypothetical protein